MTKLTRLAAAAALAALALTVGAQTSKAQGPVDPLDPVVADPANYKVVYEDENVRVMKYDDVPGYVGPKHHHLLPYDVYVITPALRQFFKEDCKTKDGDPRLLTPSDKPLKPPVPVTHCEANVGLTDTHLLIVEYKKQPPSSSTQPAAGASRRSVGRSSRRSRP